MEYKHKKTKAQDSELGISSDLRIRGSRFASPVATAVVESCEISAPSVGVALVFSLLSQQVQLVRESRTVHHLLDIPVLIFSHLT
jgi:hypothetical protein